MVQRRKISVFRTSDADVSSGNAVFLFHQRRRFDAPCGRLPRNDNNTGPKKVGNKIQHSQKRQKPGGFNLAKKKSEETAATAAKDTAAVKDPADSKKRRARSAKAESESPAEVKQPKTARKHTKQTAQHVEPDKRRAKKVAAPAKPEQAELSPEEVQVAKTQEPPETQEAQPKETAAPAPQNDNGQYRHVHPKFGFNFLETQSLTDLRGIAKETGVTSYSSLRKDDLIIEILRVQAEQLGYRFGGGTLECLQEGYGFLRPSGLLPSSNDIYVSASQIRRFGLRNGDIVWGIIRPPKDQEHYEALLRVENVNFTDPEEARKRPHFEALTPIFPTEKLNLETDRKIVSTRIVDLFAPIGKGQRALIVSPPKAGKTTLLKNLANAITINHPEVILMVVLIDERPEEVTDMARSVNGEIIASTFDRPSEEHMRVAGLALEKAKRLVEVGKDVVLLLDSITRLARASNLIVPPSGRTLSGGMDPAALYFPKKFFGAARNIENGGSLTIIGTSLVETGSRMDDVIYEEFKGTGNMEVHLSRKISEQRIFPALDITKSGTRKEELLVPEDDLQRIWVLRKKIINMDEAEVLNLILDRLRSSATNKDFLATIKVD